MSNRWQHKVTEVPYKLFANQTEQLQQELDKHGQQGWELVSVVQSQSSHTLRLFFKKPA
ncbi:DUF4177 domain-containing protein [Marilutibacter spongiae]|uniref:DUF4177 domain-containing protein n=1 Tax=Marilutibacter spongiae TaxID=2025720 RepID=A0A7W3TN48_9GAMM|nr:DUF4177 domain-containing protein [Lysobacter spongiae]MBB1061390.1 DUF4177 domain-containing protein [Lysobacter spongiae]